VVGVVLLWLSHTWTTREKAIGTLLALGVGALALLSLSSPVEWIRPLLAMVLTIPTVIYLGSGCAPTPTRCPPPADARLATGWCLGSQAGCERPQVGVELVGDLEEGAVADALVPGGLGVGDEPGVVLGHGREDDLIVGPMGHQDRVVSPSSRPAWVSVRLSMAWRTCGGTTLL
jgi:hypothetical protein